MFIGINDYQYIRVRDLKFAEDDATMMRDTFVATTELTEENSLLLTGTNASRMNIGKAIRGWLAERATFEDTVVVYFAGHGTQMIDDNGDEEDGKDECLLAWDSGLLDISYIRDDDMNRWLGAVAAGTKIVMIDACHSGTSTRQMEGLQVRASDLSWTDIQLSPVERQLEVEREIETALREANISLPILYSESDFIEPSPDSGAIELAGCRSDQVVVESSALKHGAFSYYVAEGLNGAADANGDGRVSLQEVHTYARERIASHGFDQEPQLSGVEGEFFVSVPAK